MRQLLTIFFISLLPLVNFANNDTILTPKKDSIMMADSLTSKLDMSGIDSLSIDYNLVELLKEATNYIKEKNQSSTSWFDKIIGSSQKLIALLIAIITLIAGYLGLRKTSFFEKYRSQLTFILFLLFFVIIASLLVDTLSAVILLIAVIIFSVLLALIVILYYLKFLDDNTYNIKNRILDNLGIKPYKVKPTERKLEDLEGYYSEFINSFKISLEAMTRYILINKESEIVLPHSIIEGFEVTRVEIEPKENSYPQWRNLNNRLLIPENIKVHFIKDISEDKSEDRKEKKYQFVALKNIQMGIAVTSNTEGKLEFYKLDYDAITKINEFLYFKNQENLNRSWKELSETMNNFKLYHL